MFWRNDLLIITPLARFIQLSAPGSVIIHKRRIQKIKCAIELCIKSDANIDVAEHVFKSRIDTPIYSHEERVCVEGIGHHSRG